jgi:glutathione reductase (NADPH)
MWNAATMAETLAESRDYCFDTEVRGFDWPRFKTKRDAYIKRLNGIYERNLGNDGVDYIRGRGRFLSQSEVEVTDGSGAKTVYGADKILIATGMHTALFLSYCGDSVG